MWCCYYYSYIGGRNKTAGNFGRDSKMNFALMHDLQFIFKPVASYTRHITISQGQTPS